MSSIAASNEIRSRLCPSNVDKSVQPCSCLPSRRTLISKNINANLPLISSSSTRKEITPVAVTTHVLSSLVEHPDDYYPNKRIEQLHHQMDEIQTSSFLKFINYHLSLKFADENKSVRNLAEDLSNGHILIDLIEIFSSIKLKREHGRTRFHSLINVQNVLDYLKSHMQHINISPHDIVSGNRKQILALLWVIMKIFDFPSFYINTKRCLFLDRNLNLIQWINQLLQKIFNRNEIFIEDFYIQTWTRHNSYLFFLVKYLSPLSEHYGSVNYFNSIKEFQQKTMTNEERLKFAVKFADYCFDLHSIVDFNDRTELSLEKFFTNFQEKILSNPLTKELIATESTDDNDEQQDEYLIFKEEIKFVTQENLPIIEHEKQNNHSKSIFILVALGFVIFIFFLSRLIKI